MEIEKKTKRRVGETLKECVGRKIVANIREGKPRDQAIAVAFSQCSLKKEVSDEIVSEILEQLERDEFLFPILEGAADAFGKASHLKPRKKKKRSNGMVYKQGEISQGEHVHPHEPTDGKHTHPDMGPTDSPGISGGHRHGFGKHRHREGDIMEGGHPNAGSGRHRHLTSTGLSSIVDKIVDAHYPVHKWILSFKQAWVMHPDEPWRTTFRSDWVEHALFSLHSAGCSFDDHMFTFTNESTRLLQVKYELKDGSFIVPGEKEWRDECDWFKTHLPEVEKFLDLNSFIEESEDEEDKD